MKCSGWLTPSLRKRVTVSLCREAGLELSGPSLGQDLLAVPSEGLAGGGDAFLRHSLGAPVVPLLLEGAGGALRRRDGAGKIGVRTAEG